MRGEFHLDYIVFFFFKQKTAYEIVSRDWSSDVCSSDLELTPLISLISIPSFVVLCCPAAAQRCLKVLKIQQKG